MQNVPQIVRLRLRAGVSPDAHPDADVLTAFAECSLGERERSAVLKHLASCADCRDVIALALPEPETASTVIVPSHSWWMSWPAFRWGFATAGVAVIAVGVWQYQRHSGAASMARLSNTEPAAVQIQPPPASQASASAPRAEEVSPNLTKNPDRILSLKKNPAPAGVGTHQFHGFASGFANRGPSLGFGPHMPSQQQQQQLQQVPGGAQAPASLPGLSQQADRAAAVAPSAPSVEARSQAAPVSSDAQNFADQSVAPAAGAPAEQMFDSNASPPVDKAKPATHSQIGVVAASVSSPQWSISADGGLQRSFDQGSSWQAVDVTAMPGANYISMAKVDMAVAKARAKQSTDKKTEQAEPARLVFRAVVANGSDVWAGGAKGALYHSIDSGNHWARIVPSANGSLLTADIVVMQFPDALHGSITTSSAETWTTSDGGQSWQKQ